MKLTTAMLAFAAATSATVTQPTRAAAQVWSGAPKPRLGLPGQVVITSEWAFDYQRETQDVDGADSVTTTTYDFHVGLDRVLRYGLTGGFRIGFRGFEQGFDSQRRFDLGARFGAIVRLAPTASLWPRVGLTYGGTTYANRTVSFITKTWTLNASLPIIWEVRPHVLLGIGPTYDQDISARYGANEGQTLGLTTGFGVRGFLGVWF